MTRRPRVVYLHGKRMTEQDGLATHLPEWVTVAMAKSVPEMLHLLAIEETDLVVCDWYFSDGTWKQALREIQARYAKLPAIVVSPTQGIEEGIQEWLEVLNAGAFDLLLAPSNEHAVFAMLEQAISSGRRRRFEVAV